MANKIKKNIFLLLLLIVINVSAYAKNNNKPTVNVLTWWGYLNYPEIKNEIEKKCNVNISYDEYYSNDEFLQRFSKEHNNYDITIFSYTIYNLIKDKIALKHSDLWKNSLQYNPIIKQHYDQGKFPPNVVFFQHSLTGFLWNPAIINISPSDQIFSIFNKAKTNLVVMIDDPVEATNLMKLGFREQNKNISDSNILTINNFKQLTQNSKVYITNGDNNIYNKPNFAFAYSWSGDAIAIITNSKNNDQFLIHPKLSYITADFLAVLNNKPEVNCVAKVLSSSEILNFIQNKDYYFSPYINENNIPKSKFRNIYLDFLKKLPELTWITPASSQYFDMLYKTWESVKVNLN